MITFHNEVNTKAKRTMTFAEHMRSLRGNLSPSAFCRTLGIPLTTYQRYEKGERVPDIEVFARVVRAVGLSADTLLGLNPMHGAQENAHLNGGSSYPGVMDCKDIVIVQQGETIQAMTHTLKLLS
jgi:transcriptional regulator with XRE-family HTH domain